MEWQGHRERVSGTPCKIWTFEFAAGTQGNILFSLAAVSS